ncbi:winged helix-turn-helix domain-containing protein [Pseudoalteromonas sp. DL2-H2.2]|uniref:winged helix-turn-helix domain-containing protein n=1 Tax=Pseudoalteromonas sp. DL2-H2.2 TaxID=2908889 RepID=UPI001F4842DD|nr:winged helix-turn-helix domain-containing protein [Pseudoalteromonas sp. DL2-H2.2]MCF2907116.1 winged helix-turn-helix domain-containing protein [Pseudoalteromonas sp. DL2-H2.2]
MKNIIIKTPKREVHYAQFTFDFARNEVRSVHGCVELEPKVMAVLLCLYQNQGVVLSQQAIFDAVWPDQIFTQSLVQRAIALIRKALGESASTAQFVRTYAKQGYCLIEYPATPNGEAKAAIRKNPILLGAALIFIVSALLIWWAWTQRLAHKTTPVTHHYTQLSALSRINQSGYGLSAFANQALYVVNEEGKYELWLKHEELETRLLQTTRSIRTSFWYQGQPAYVVNESDDRSEFLTLGPDNTPQRIVTLPHRVESMPVMIGPSLYYASGNNIFRFNPHTRATSAVAVFERGDSILDLTYIEKPQQLAILLDLGQSQRQVISLDLQTGATVTLFEGSGTYQSLAWQNHTAQLLMSKGAQLQSLTLSGEVTLLPFANNQVITRLTPIEHNLRAALKHSSIYSGTSGIQ